MRSTPAETSPSSGGPRPEAVLSEAEWLLELIVDDPVENAHADALVNLSNGFQGIRSSADPTDLYAEPSFLVTEVYDAGVDVRRQIVNLPHPLGWRLRRGHETLAGTGRVRRVLDLRRGLCHVERTLTTGDGEAWHFATTTLLHATRPEVGLLFGRIEGPPGTGEVAAELFWDNTTGNPYLGGHVPAVRTFHATPSRVVFDGDGVSADCVLAGSGDVVRLSSALDCPHQVGRHRVRDRARWGEVIVARPDRGTVSFTLAWTVGGTPGTAVTALRESALLAQEHVDEWARRWNEHDVLVEGDERSQQALRVGLYHLMQHELPARPVKLTPARGLSGAYHSGATFFDTELHKDAFWTWTDPEVALSHLAFRYRTLPAAREFARTSGFAGARFPVAADDAGQDTGPHDVLVLGNSRRVPEWNVRQVVHVSADVAYAVHRYHRVTGDDEFLFTQGIELLVETARFAASVLTWSEEHQAHRSCSVMGPDEYHHHVDDNLYTNTMLQWNLNTTLSTLGWAAERDARRADDLRRRLEIDDDLLERWRTIASTVRTPTALPGGVPAQHEGYGDLPDCTPRVDDGTPVPRLTDDDRRTAGNGVSLRSKLVKQADVVLLAHLLPEAFTDTAALAVLDYYEPRTAHASSLSFAPHGVVAARAGDADRALRFFLRSTRYDLDYQPRAHYRNGLHLSAYAGAWQVLAEGFLDLRATDEGISVRPGLPSAWTRVRLPFRYGRSRLAVTAGRTETVVRLLSGPAVRVHVNGRPAVLSSSADTFRCATDLPEPEDERLTCG
ncbi:glycosyl hydrolase family 65 protein [Actinoplanes sp. NPDC049265]|uniref:glycosyl hydrolase family 65 protein n=1 Tax=Actinoplanes sp. NPDC049265 TaxID=3363902 RepID=UPI003712489C